MLVFLEHLILTAALLLLVSNLVTAFMCRAGVLHSSARLFSVS